MRHFSALLGAPRACADFCDPTEVSRFNLESAVERPVECVGFCDWRGAMRTRPWMAEGRTPTVGALGDAGAVVE